MAFLYAELATWFLRAGSESRAESALFALAAHGATCEGHVEEPNGVAGV